MEELELLELLKDKKIADAYQYYKACLYKLYLAEISFEALSNVITEYQQSEKTVVEKVYEDAITKGKGSLNAHANNVNYLGIEVSSTIMIDKLTIEIMSLLHNFFDTFAQWLNAGLFAEDGVPMERVSLSKVVGKFSQFPEYTGKFIADIIDLPVSSDYQYIADFNNTLKHRRQIYVENKFDILNIKGSVMIPRFEKDGRPYMKENVLPVLRSKIDFCKNILDESETYIKTFYSQCDNQHVLHRIYNPKTYLLFENEEDYKKFSSPKSHYHYIEVDKNNIADEYHIMLACDRMDDEGLSSFSEIPWEYHWKLVGYNPAFLKIGRTYAIHPRKSWVQPALLHMIRLALANNMWNRFMFFSIPRYTTFAYPICFLTMRNACSTLQRTADLSCSIFCPS